MKHQDKITRRKVRVGYRTFSLKSWVVEVDTGVDMLKCPDCGGRMTMDRFLLAVGTKGTSYCPYCGAKR